MKILTYNQIWNGGIAFLIQQDKNHIVKSLILEEVKQGERIDPTGQLSYEEAQELMDGLWQCGIRPTEGKGSAGALKATERHLEDMRALVFKK